MIPCLALNAMANPEYNRPPEETWMNTHHWIGILVAGLSTNLAPLSAHALPFGVSDLIEVVDGNGTIMTDLNGHPAVATIQEGATGPVSFELIVPDVVAFSTAGLVGL